MKKRTEFGKKQVFVCSDVSFGKRQRNGETKNKFNPRKLGGPHGNPTENGWLLGQSYGKWVVVKKRSE